MSGQDVTGKTSTSDLQQQVELIRDKTGMVLAHLIPLQQVASDLNSIIGFRPVDKLATELIEEGYPTKGFHLKGKSASWGGQAGFICIDQGFSKLENASSERITQSNGQTQLCIREGRAIAVLLDIPRGRLQNLLKNDMIDHFSLENADGICSFRAKGPSGQHYEFEAQRLPGDGEVCYRILHNGSPIEVLAPTSSTRPFTADYDLLLIAPHMSDLGPQDNVQVLDVAHQVFRDRLDHYSKLPSHPELRGDYDDPTSFYRKSDREISNTSERVRHMIPIINQALVGEGEKVVHHATDTTNPVTDPESNFPATFVLPTKLGRFNHICVIENTCELAELVVYAKNAGCHVPLHPLWEKEMVQSRNPRFEEARTTLASALQNRPGFSDER
jgi:hypothetical protein